jgi:hypothetical protein
VAAAEPQKHTLNRLPNFNVCGSFRSQDERLQCEIRPACPADRELNLVWTQNGKHHVEHFADAADAERRRKHLEDNLKNDGWTRIGRVTPPPKRPLL